MDLEFFTIGVYGSNESSYFSKLIKNNIDLFIDVRQRRGVRGAKYSYVNSKRLQHKLSELGIQYLHIIDLAPTKEIRTLQRIDDEKNKNTKRSREELGVIFKENYINKILKPFDIDSFIQSLMNSGSKKVVFFCVENHPRACHRSLITDLLSKNYNFTINHL